MGRGRKGEIQGKRIVKIVGSEFKEQENLTQHFKSSTTKGVVFTYSEKEDDVSPKMTWL